MMVEEKDWSLEEAVKYNGADRVVHFSEYLSLKENETAQVKRFRCGFSLFDAAIGGLATGEVIVITGHRKEGKTTFAESWLKSMSEIDPSARSMILSYEMPPIQLLQKYKDDLRRPIYVPLSLESANFEWLKKRCLEAKYKHMANIVMIDHLDHLVDMSLTQNMAINIGAFMRRLKTDIAMQHNLAVLLVAHQSQPRQDKEPSVDTLRGSASIGQESDATIVVMRRENLDYVELKDFLEKYGEEKAMKISPPLLADPDDASSAKLAIVKVECHRRTGAWKWKKLFRKNGEFLEEV